MGSLQIIVGVLEENLFASLESINRTLEVAIFVILVGHQGFDAGR